jgi:hypothetical protein
MARYNAATILVLIISLMFIVQSVHWLGQAGVPDFFRITTRTREFWNSTLEVDVNEIGLETLYNASQRIFAQSFIMSPSASKGQAAVSIANNTVHTFQEKLDMKSSTKVQLNNSCVGAAAFGFDHNPRCYGNQLVRSVKVFGCDCKEKNGVKYLNPSSNATYTIELFPADSVHQVHKSKADCKLALIRESPAIIPGTYRSFHQNKKISAPFHKIFTTASTLIDSNHTKFTRYLLAMSWVRKDPRMASESQVAEYYLQQAIQSKAMGISIILSHKKFAPVRIQ